MYHRKAPYYQKLSAISEWITLKNYNPLPSWRASNGLLLDMQSKQLFIDEPRYLVRIKHFLLILANFTIHLVGVPLMMARDLFHACCSLGYAFSYLLKQDNLAFFDFLGLSCKLLLSCLVKPLAWGLLSACNILGVLFLPYGCRKVYASLERDIYQTSIIAPCFQPMICSHSQDKPIPFQLPCKKSRLLPNTRPIKHLMGSTPNKPGW